ncbi:hypothetical protein BH10PAT1_BH10PAT1_1470 [soil metagenome]
MNKLIRVCAVISGISGFVVLSWVFFPILKYQIEAPKLMTFLSPIPDGDVLGATINNTTSDYTDAATWFPDAKTNSNFTNSPVSFYKLSVPRLGIKDAVVSIGGEDLSKSLIQYPGTALPGQIGNAVIFGHSVLPAFYNPTNYLTIFSTVPTLVKGDTMTVNYDGITYKYQVEEKYEVQPTDISILNQDDSDSFLTLVTCVPPGLTTRRGIIKARIVPVGGNYVSGI